ncbi:hypothetical protein A4H97_10450 [Niastella yeongjuensis]|uniref:Uncharacterized protein n=1 Tax=Niastella yeongjuensis TaxID=354355 RepID=A0A1V9EF77_9BACT|nr:hypothetical protein [Niastella yeongjuensis]OQP44773.1 hypothetical protein A4H97_10450 [Niastella yeongjuensis]
MLQNRVNPLGEIISTKARGAWMGNRGLLHNDKQEIVRPFRLPAWITCVLAFKNRKRIVMSPGLYTELFFLDEATAFSAGHRPCKECRRNDHLRFKKYWLLGNPGYDFNEKTSITEIDKIIHRERLGVNNTKVTFLAEISELPDGTFILLDEKPFLIKGDWLYAWTPAGYDTGIIKPGKLEVTVLTPASIVSAFKAGYLPQMAV